MIKPGTKTKLILAAETGMFCLILITIWLDEFLDLPKILLGAPATPYRIEEYLLETILISIVAVFVIVITFMLLQKIERLDRYLRVCAWCRSVWFDGKWVNFEQYMEGRHALQATHGICEKCHEKLMRENRGDAAVKDQQ